MAVSQNGGGCPIYTLNIEQNPLKGHPKKGSPVNSETP